MAKFLDRWQKGAKKIYCTNCDSSQLIMIGHNIAECTVCRAVRAV